MKENKNIDRAVIMSIMQVLINPNMDIMTQHSVIKELMQIWAIKEKHEMNQATMNENN